MGIVASLRRNPLYRQYRERGFCVLRDVLPIADIDELAQLARSTVPEYRGELLRQSGHPEVNEFFPGTRLIRNSPFNLQLGLAKELRPLCEALRRVISAPVLARKLHELDGADHYHINQTLLFYAAQTTNLHLDSWGLDTVPHGGAHTLWIPLQDLDARSGVPAVVPWPLRKLVTEAELGLPPNMPHEERYDQYHRALAAKVMADAPDVATALVRRGDLLVWSSLTPHFTLPSQPFPV